MAHAKAKHPELRVIRGGKGSVRRAYDACRVAGNTALDVPVITILSPDDAAYAAAVAERLRKH